MDMPCAHSLVSGPAGCISLLKRRMARQVDDALRQEEGRQVWRVLLGRRGAAGYHLQAAGWSAHKPVQVLTRTAWLTEVTCSCPLLGRRLALACCACGCWALHCGAGCLCRGHTPAGPPRVVKLIRARSDALLWWSMGALRGPAAVLWACRCSHELSALLHSTQGRARKPLPVPHTGGCSAPNTAFTRCHDHLESPVRLTCDGHASPAREGPDACPWPVSSTSDAPQAPSAPASLQGSQATDPGGR